MYTCWSCIIKVDIVLIIAKDDDDADDDDDQDDVVMNYGITTPDYFHNVGADDNDDGVLIMIYML